MKKFPLKLEDLTPKESSFTLSTKPGVKIELCRWSLRVRAWAIEHFGAAELRAILEQQKIVQMAQIAHFMLKDKTLFASLDEFLDSVVTPEDHLNVLSAMLETVGIGEPEIEQVRKAWKEGTEPPKTKPQRKPRRPIGANSSTP